MTIRIGAWYRTCQECGHEQLAQKPNPSRELTPSYANSKCRICKSQALDYGKTKSEEWEI